MSNSAFTIANGGGDAGAVAATQAQLETGTDVATFTSPGRQQYHPSAVKAWVKYDTVTGLDGSYNVTSNTDDGQNRHTITWTTVFSSTSYSVSATPNADASDTAASSWSAQVNASSFLVGSCGITTTDSNGNYSVGEVNYTFTQAWGDQ
jgi:hypothetical protein